MFRIIRFANHDGKIRLTIETDDSTVPLFLRFLRDAQKFSELFDYRLRTEIRADASRKSRPDRLAQAHIERAGILARYRDLSGPRYQRLKVLKEMLSTEEDSVTIDRLESQLRLARQDEKNNCLSRIRRLMNDGCSLNEIALSLALPKSTVARYATKLEAVAQDERPSVPSLCERRSPRRRRSAT